MAIVICSPCKQEFASDEAYLAHACPAADGAMPTSPDYLRKTTTPNYDAIAASAQHRSQQQGQQPS